MESQMMPEPTNDGERFSLDLPFWINGTLDVDDRIWMQEYLRAHPECELDVRFARLLHENAQSITAPSAEHERIESLLRSLNDTPAPPPKRLGRR